MTLNFITSQIFGLIASIMYLWIFLFILHNSLIRLTRFKSRWSKAVSSTAFLMFTGILYTWLSVVQSTPNPFILPSHLFLLGTTWMEYYRGSKGDQANG